jgi:hypothetical protein
LVVDSHAQYACLFDRKVDGAGVRLGVTRDVTQGLLGYAVGSHLHCRRQWRQTLRRFHRDAQALRAILRGTLAQGAEEAEVVERRRPEPVDQATDVDDGILSIRLQVEQQLLGGVWVSPHELADGVDRERLAGELGSNPACRSLLRRRRTANLDPFLTGLEGSLSSELVLPLWGGATADNVAFRQAYQYCNTAMT